VVDTDTARVMADKLRCVAKLSLSGSSEGYITEQALLLLIQRCLTLTFVSATWGYMKPENIVYPVHYVGSRLQIVSMYSSEGSTVHAIVSCCKYLHTLILARPEKCTNSTVPAALHCIVGSSVQVLELTGYVVTDTELLQLQHMSIAK